MAAALPSQPNRQQRVRGRRAASGSGNDTCRHQTSACITMPFIWRFLNDDDDDVLNCALLKPTVCGVFVWKETRARSRPIVKYYCHRSIIIIIIIILIAARWTFYDYCEERIVGRYHDSKKSIKCIHVYVYKL